MSLNGCLLDSDYQFINKIGAGAYGLVYHVKQLSTNKHFAVKILLKDTSHHHSKDKDHVEKKIFEYAYSNKGLIEVKKLSPRLLINHGEQCSFLKEVALHLKVHNHPNVLTIHTVYHNPIALFIIMDYHPEGDLFQAIVDRKVFVKKPHLIKAIIIQLIDVLNYIHSKNVYHCDIKPENILIDKNGEKIILADFGLSMSDNYISSKICCGSSYYMAPERLRKGNNDVLSLTMAGDVWSLGVILINLICIRNPWMNASLTDDTFRAYIEDNKTLQSILPVSVEFNNILNKIFRMEPSERISLLDLRNEIIGINKFTTNGPLSDFSKVLYEYHQLEDHDHSYCDKFFDNCLINDYTSMASHSSSSSSEPSTINNGCPFAPKSQGSEIPDIRDLPTSHINIESLLNPVASEDFGKKTDNIQKWDYTNYLLSNVYSLNKNLSVNY